MCRRVNCAKCGRPTYAGCGAHVEQVLADVATAERCHCREASLHAHESHSEDKQPRVMPK
jgi:hypothetical protein